MDPLKGRSKGHFPRHQDNTVGLRSLGSNTLYNAAVIRFYTPE